jgi:hypothetical protein
VQCLASCTACMNPYNDAIHSQWRLTWHMSQSSCDSAVKCEKCIAYLWTMFCYTEFGKNADVTLITNHTHFNTTCGILYSRIYLSGTFQNWYSSIPNQTWQYCKPKRAKQLTNFTVFMSSALQCVLSKQHQ